MINLTTLTINKAHDALVKGEFSARDLAEAYLKEIEKQNQTLNAYLEVFSDVREQAEAADKKIKTGKAKLLTGVPLAIKDNILIEGRRVSAASKILEGYRASYDATVIKKLKEQGVVFLGRTNCDEFAMGGSTENSAFGVTKNPTDTSRVAGGSSGGSAAAVAAHLALGALGSDTGGSIRQPAAFCGVVGFKPTYGAVSRSGLIAMSSSFDCIGPLGKTVADTESLFGVIQGRDSSDSTSREINTKYQTPDTKKIVVGVPKMIADAEGMEKEVRENFEASLALLKKRGCEVREVALPSLSYALAVYYVIMPAEVSTNLARFDGVKYGLHLSGADLLDDYQKTRGNGFGEEARRRILLGTFVLSSGYYDAYYGKAVAARRAIQDELAEVFASGVDVVATPTTPTPAFKIGEKASDPLAMYLGDIFTVTANIAGIPAISIPSGQTASGLPLGLQLMAAAGSDDLLFEAGKRFETARA